VSTDKAIVPDNLGGAKFDFFHPTTSSRNNLNNHSMVTVITFAGCKILIPGDNESPSWNELLQRTDFVQAIKGTDILVAPHHGREAGYSASLFDYISPRLTIVSDGPGSETSAVTKYSQKSSGWRVYSRSMPQGQGEIRKCISTRHDQTIVVKFGRNANTQNNYINVTTA
jgi:competence protein ComEC